MQSYRYSCTWYSRCLAGQHPKMGPIAALFALSTLSGVATGRIAPFSDRIQAEERQMSRRQMQRQVSSPSPPSATASSQSQCCCGDYEESASCCGTPACPNSAHSRGNATNCHNVEGEAVDDVDPGECERMDDGGMLAVALILGVICMAWPLIIFCITWCLCIQPRNSAQQSSRPTQQAWMSCCLVFWLVTFFGGLITGWLWLLGPFVMVVPFCMNECYTDGTDSRTQRRHAGVTVPNQPHGVQPCGGDQGGQVVMATVVTSSNPVLHGSSPVHAQSTVIGQQPQYGQTYVQQPQIAQPVATAGAQQQGGLYGHVQPMVSVVATPTHAAPATTVTAVNNHTGFVTDDA